MIEILDLNENLLNDFLDLLNCRGGGNSEIERMVYSQPKYYGGFIAYVDKIPAGCIGFVKRDLNRAEINKISWFNDWYVKDGFQGLSIGKQLIQKVANYTGASCGIISPLGSRQIGLKSGFQINTMILECRFPISPMKIGYNLYFQNNKYQDSLIKRVVRTVVYKLISGYNLAQVQKSKFTNGPIQIILKELKSTSNLLITDPDFFKFTIEILKYQKNNKLDFWTIQNTDFWSCGFVFTKKNGLRESVVLYVSNLNNEKAYSIYSNIISSIKENTDANQVNIILNQNLVNKFNLNNKFISSLAFFTFQMPPLAESFIHHLDKDSSWRF
jgi:hypothetical protein